MIFYVIIGFFAAFGALCVLWVLLGAWLTAPADSHIVIHPAPGREDGAVRRYLWLRNLGLLKGPLTVIADTSPAITDQYPNVEFLTLEQYTAQLIEERKKLDGT